MELRYLGFDQMRNARAFRFEIVAKGLPTREAVVTADMGLFLEQGVGIQEGPTLCAGKLAADLNLQVEGEHTLTRDDLQAHAARRAADEARRAELRAASGRRRHGAPASYETPRDRI